MDQMDFPKTIKHTLFSRNFLNFWDFLRKYVQMPFKGKFYMRFDHRIAFFWRPPLKFSEYHCKKAPFEKFPGIYTRNESRKVVQKVAFSDARS